MLKWTTKRLEIKTLWVLIAVLVCLLLISWNKNCVTKIPTSANENEQADSSRSQGKIGSNRLFEKYKNAAKNIASVEHTPGDLAQLGVMSKESDGFVPSGTKSIDSNLVETLSDQMYVKPKNLATNIEGDSLWDKFYENDIDDNTQLHTLTKTRKNEQHNNQRNEWVPTEHIIPESHTISTDIVSNCITGETIWSYSGVDMNTEPLSLDELNGSYEEKASARYWSFVHVFDSRAWGHGWDQNHRGLNASGRGATLDWTQEAIATLHTTLNYVKHHLGKSRITLLDVPCGDMAWMARFLKTRSDVRYTGMDIVPDLIKHHRETYKAFRNWDFVNADVVNDDVKLESYDVILCRMMLQHLYNHDILKLLGKFSRSGSKFVLLTTFPSHKQNNELVIEDDNPGRYRPVNLQILPFSLIPPLCMHRDGPPEVKEAWQHFIGLWRLPLVSVSRCEEKVIKSPQLPTDMYVCM